MEEALYRAGGLPGKGGRTSLAVPGGVFPFEVLRPQDIISLTQVGSRSSAYNFLLMADKYDARVCTAESLTAGQIMASLVDVPFKGWRKWGCFGVYDTGAKEKYLNINVRQEVDDEDAVYTSKCAAEMAIGALLNSRNDESKGINLANFAVSVTGNAMPLKGRESFLGQVYIGVACYVNDGTKKGMRNIDIDKKVVDTCGIYVNTKMIDALNVYKHLSKIWKKRPQEEVHMEDAFNAMAMNAASDKELPEWVDGYNDIHFTTLVAGIIRNSTTKQALDFAKDELTRIMDTEAIVREEWKTSFDKMAPNRTFYGTDDNTSQPVNTIIRAENIS